MVQSVPVNHAVQPLVSPSTDLEPLSASIEKRMVAAIDIGTNSIHMVVVQINPELPAFEIIDTEKSTVRLGERNPETGALTEAAMQRAMDSLNRCMEIAKAKNVEQVIAAATSAVREAPNGSTFIQRVEDKIGLTIDIIAGEEEARRIYLGVLSGMEFEGKPHVIIDIGGGSTELILGDGKKARNLSSTKVGAVRLSELFVKHDPITKREFSQMRAYVRGMLEKPVDNLRSHLSADEVPRLIGTSGTIESLLKVSACESMGTCPTSLHGYELTLDQLRELVQRFSKLSFDDRCKVSGMSDRRAEIILPGAVVLLEAMELLGLKTLKTCERSLREGMIVDWMMKQGLIEDRLKYQGSVRERTVMHLAQRYHVNLDSAQRIAQFSLQMFDQLQGLLHHWDADDRDLLWSAAILHNTGHFVSHSAHHKHSYYLIRNAGLLGFSNIEIELIANIARYHRKGPPKKKHESYGALNKKNRKRIDQLSAILKLAVALDRREIGAIADLDCVYHAASKSVILHLKPQLAEDACSLELWSLDYKKTSFEGEFNVSVTAQLDRGIMNASRS